MRSSCSIRPSPTGSGTRSSTPTPPQRQGWPAIARGESTLILAPTGSGKTLAAFLWCIDRLMFDAAAGRRRARCRVLYVSPLKALAVDVERNLRAPLAGIANRAAARGDAYHVPAIAIRTGDTPAIERARFQREPADILITTPESLYLLLTSNAREALRSRRHGHHRRDSRAGADQARRAPGAVARAARARCAGRAAAAHRPVRDAAAARRSRALPRRRRRRAPRGGRRNRRRPRACRRTTCGARRSRSTTSSPATTALDACRPVTIVDAREQKRLELRIEVPVEDMARIGQPDRDPERAPASQGPVRTSIWTSDPPAPAGADAGAPLDADLRQQPAARRASGRRAERAGRRNCSCARITGRLRGQQRIEVEDLLKAGQLRGAGRHLVARARHRHGRDRSRHPDRGAAVGGERPAAHRPRGPSGRRGEPRHRSSRSSAAICVACAAVTRGDARGRRSNRPAIRATRSTCSRSRSSRWSSMDDVARRRAVRRSCAARRRSPS